MVIIGLTGSIAMGKSTASDLLRSRRMPVHDSDAVVHRLLASGGAAVPLVGAIFPDVVVDGAVDRAKLGRLVFGQPGNLRRLEQIIHPLVVDSTARFVKQAVRQRRRAILLDVPLLFETGRDAWVDAKLVVSAPFFLQRMRVLSRPSMTEERFQHILSLQMPDREKRRRADFVIPTGLGRGVTMRALRAAVRSACRRGSHRWPPKLLRVARVHALGRDANDTVPSIGPERHG